MPMTQRPTASVRVGSGAAIGISQDDQLIVDRGIVLSSAAGSGAFASGGNIITVNGTLSGNDGLGMNDGTVAVGRYGTISGTFALYSGGGAINLTNYGTVSGDHVGVDVRGSADITNYGLICSGLDTQFDGNAAISLSQTHSGATITNEGTITARLEGSYAIFSADDNTASDVVINMGTINGLVSLGGGGDKFFTAKGRVNGTVDGGAGTDTLKGGRFADHLIGGADNDRLTGGDGSDTFEFHPGEGIDIINDFDAIGGGRKQDYLLLDEDMTFTVGSANKGRDTVLDFGDGQTITLLHVRKSDFFIADIHHPVDTDHASWM